MLREREREREGAGEREREISSESGRGRGKAISIFLSHPDGLESIQVLPVLIKSRVSRD
jgi:hypothetical protein